MWIQRYRLLPIRKKILYSGLALLFSVAIIGGIAGVLILEDIKTIAESPVGEKATQLSQNVADGKSTLFDIYKEVGEFIKESDSSVLNRGFYAQIIYNLLGFTGVALLMGWLFLPKGIRSFTTENRSIILFFASFVLAVNFPQIAADATHLNELFGLDILQEKLLGVSEADDYNDLISQFLMILPNESRGWLITIIGVALIPAVGEELMFRGLFQRLFSQRFNPHNGIAITALLFALVHFNFTNFFYYFILGVALGYAYYWGKNILFPIIIHFINNSLVLLQYIQVQAISKDEYLAIQSEEEQSFALMRYVTVGLCLLIFYMNYQRRQFLIK